MDEEWFTPERELGQRHKRSHAEMSVTLSPTPIDLRGPSSSNYARYSATPAPLDNNLLFPRRRTSHPHNPPPPFQAAEDMSQQAQPRPRLEHRASQTIIDLTEAEDVEPLVGRRDRAPSHRPPQLDRSDSQRLGAGVIDLTSDDEEIQITGARNRDLPLPHPDFARPRPYPHVQLPRLARPDSPGLFVPHDPPHQRHINRVFPQAFDLMVGPGDLGGGGLQLSRQQDINDMIHRVQMHRFNVQQILPGRLDYAHHAFADRKPEYVAPEPAKTGFTRTPKDGDTIICPSCEEELVHDKQSDEPLLKKSGKALTKKDREEHPFWVVKDCGHVYCNRCFQNRTPTSKQPANVSFPEGKPTGKSKTKGVKCAVEDCETDVKSKDKWIGVFL